MLSIFGALFVCRFGCYSVPGRVFKKTILSYSHKIQRSKSKSTFGMLPILLLVPFLTNDVTFYGIWPLIYFITKIMLSVECWIGRYTMIFPWFSKLIYYLLSINYFEIIMFLHYFWNVWPRRNQSLRKWQNYTIALRTISTHNFDPCSNIILHKPWNWNNK